MNAQRLSSGRLVQLDRRLTDRDRQIIATLRLVRVATARQLQRLWFTGGTPRANARNTQRRLRTLASLGVIMRLDRPPGGVGGGSAGHVYALDLAGVRLTARGRPVRRPWPVSRLFVDHGLAVTELYVRLMEAQRTGQIELLEFAAEPASWRVYVGPGGSALTLKPDAFARLGHGEWEEWWFIELDRATEHAPAVRRQLDRYVSYWRSGAEQGRSDGLFPHILWVVPDEARREQVATLLTRLPAEAQPLFEVVVTGQAVARLTEAAPPDNQEPP